MGSPTFFLRAPQGVNANNNLEKYLWKTFVQTCNDSTLNIRDSV